MKVKLIGYKAKVRYKSDRYYFERYWHLRDERNSTVRRYLDEHEEVVIWEGELELNVPEIGDSIFVEDIEKRFEVSNTAVNTGGGIVCWTNEVVEEIEDETTKTTLETARAREREVEIERIQKEAERKIEEKCGQEGEWVTPKKWYQFWK